MGALRSYWTAHCGDHVLVESFLYRFYLPVRTCVVEQELKGECRARVLIRICCVYCVEHEFALAIVCGAAE